MSGNKYSGSSCFDPASEYKKINRVNPIALLRGERQTDAASAAVEQSPATGKTRAFPGAELDIQNIRYRPIGVTSGTDGSHRVLAVGTPDRKAEGIDINALKSNKPFLSASTQKNSAWIIQKLAILGFDYKDLLNLKIPEAMMDERVTIEYLVPKNCGAADRKQTKVVMGTEARNAFVSLVNSFTGKEPLEAQQHELIKTFLDLFNFETQDEHVPRAEWCHVIARMLHEKGANANYYDNLVAATCFVNTRMTLFESVAKRFAQEGHDVSLQISYRCFKGTRVLADNIVMTLVIDGHIFNLTIEPFKVPSPDEIGSVHDADYIYEFIKRTLNAEKPTTIDRREHTKIDNVNNEKESSLLYKEEESPISTSNPYSSFSTFGSLFTSYSSSGRNDFLKQLEEPSPLKSKIPKIADSSENTSEQDESRHPLSFNPN